MRISGQFIIGRLEVSNELLQSTMVSFVLNFLTNLLAAVKQIFRATFLFLCFIFVRFCVFLIRLFCLFVYF